MKISFTKLTDDRHRLEIERADGTTESVELETRSLLLHDLVHYAVEAEAGIEDGFWGLLARGFTLAALSDGSMQDPPSPGLARAERLVGPMQSLYNGRLDEAIYIQHAKVNAAFVAGVRERLRALDGHWNATPFHHTMTITWPPQKPKATS